MLAKVTRTSIIGCDSSSHGITAEKEKNTAVVTHYKICASTVHFFGPTGYLANESHDTKISCQAGSKTTNLLHNMIQLLAAKCANRSRF